ncbi:MAG: FecR family protein, partial [Planctomycetota bacterium]
MAERVEDLLLRCLDGEAAPAERRALYTRLRSDGRLDRLLRALLASDHLLQAHFTTADDGFADALLARLRRSSSRRFIGRVVGTLAARRRRARRIAWAIAAVLCGALALGLARWHQGPGTTPGAEAPSLAQSHLHRWHGRLLRAGPDGWHEVAAGATLRRGDRLRTAPDAGLDLSGPAQSELALNGGSELVIRDEHAFALHNGALAAEVPPHAGRAPLEILAGGAAVVVTGTALRVDAGPLSAAVAVDRGSVRVVAGGVECSVAPGEVATWPHRGTPSLGQVTAGPAVLDHDYTVGLPPRTTGDWVAEDGGFARPQVMDEPQQGILHATIRHHGVYPAGVAHLGPQDLIRLRLRVTMRNSWVVLLCGMRDAAGEHFNLIHTVAGLDPDAGWQEVTVPLWRFRDTRGGGLGGRG